jgi:energy-coupling factor transport system ATP-binding protein
VTLVTSSPPPAIAVLGVTFEYPQQETPALCDVSLSIPAGQFLAIEGSTGSGKTTLALTLNGIIPHSTAGRFKGNVLINGRNTKETSVAELAREVGVVYQDPEAQLFGLTVEEDVAFGLENLGLPRPEMHGRAHWALDAVGLLEHRRRSPSNLSGGQKQRLAIASVLAMRPQIMILDEPTAELDPLGKENIFAITRRLCREFGLTVVLVEHECDFIAAYADRIVLVREGAIVLDERPAQFFNQVGRRGLKEVRVPQVTQAWDLVAVGASTSLIIPDLPVELDDATTRFATLLAGERRVTSRGALASALDARLAAAISEEVSEPALLTVSNVSFAYPDGTRALTDISMNIERGAKLALIGQNASGKTTLARHLNGLLRPVTGSVLVAGSDIKDLSVAQISKRVGYVFQNPDHQLFSDTVAGELMLGPRNHGVAAEQAEEQVNRALRLCGIEHLRAEHPLFTSRGERQLIAVASVVAMEPDVLVFDEPTTGLDENYYGLVSTLIDGLRGRGHTVVVISHDMRLVAEHTDRTILLDHGRIIADGPTPEIFDQLEILATSQIAPPQITQLSHRLCRFGVRVSMSVSDFVEQMPVRREIARGQRDAGSPQPLINPTAK